MPDYGLGRLRSVDERDSLYPLKVRKAELRSYKYYRTGPVLDQGATPTCVGHAWRQWLSSAVMMTKGGFSAFDIYDGAKQNDEWGGENYDGTSVRGGAKFLQQSGRIVEYQWAQTLDDMKKWLLSGSGTLVAGTNWYTDMFSPDSMNFLIPSGRIAGGHAYLLIGYSSQRDSFRMINSWGADWGDKGRAWIHSESMKKLMDEGEFCAAIEKKV